MGAQTFVGADGLLARPLTAVGRNKVHMAAIRVVNHQILAGDPENHQDVCTAPAFWSEETYPRTIPGPC